MSRSVKKGPFVEESLMKKIETMNAANDKHVVKTWSIELWVVIVAFVLIILSLILNIVSLAKIQRINNDNR